MLSNSTSASITVIALNNISQGSITFNTLNFLTGGLYPASYPPVVLNTLPYNSSGGTTGTTILQCYMDQQYSAGSHGPVSAPSPCSGVATFNMPNGSPMVISWDLDAWSGGPVPTINPGSAYTVTGANTPTVSGYNYTFNLVFATQ